MPSDVSPSTSAGAGAFLPFQSGAGTGLRRGLCQQGDALRREIAIKRLDKRAKERLVSEAGPVRE